MDKKKICTQGVIILAVLFAAYSIIVFLLPFKMNNVFRISYLFTAAAFAVQVYVFRLSFTKGKDVRSKVYGFPIARIGILYLVIQLVAGMVFMTLAASIPVWIPAVIYVLLLAAAVIGVIASDAMRDEIERQDDKLKTNVSAMRAMQSKASALPGRCHDAGLTPSLQKLADDFKYSDPVSCEVLEETERELSGLLNGLELAIVDGDSVAAAQLCQKVEAALSERNRLCKLGKGS